MTTTRKEKKRKRVKSEISNNFKTLLTYSPILKTKKRIAINKQKQDDEERTSRRH